jgi:hypothetical protein
MKRLLIIASIGTMFSVCAVSYSDATEIKKELTGQFLNSTSTVVDAPAKAAFIYDAVIPVSIVMPEMRLRYREFTDFNNSFNGVLKSLTRDRSPPKSVHLI